MKIICTNEEKQEIIKALSFMYECDKYLGMNGYKQGKTVHDLIESKIEWEIEKG